MHYNYNPSSKTSVFLATFVVGLFGTVMVMSIISYCYPALMTQSLRIVMMLNAIFFMPCYAALYTWSTEKNLSIEESKKRKIMRFVFIGLYLVALLLITRYFQ